MTKVNFLQVLITLSLSTVSLSLVDPDGPRIVGGFDANPLATSHQVSIRLSNENSFGGGHFCGGSLIGPSSVLTAAHCLVNLKTGKTLSASSLRVVGGSSNRWIATSDTVIRNVQQVIVHGGYSGKYMENDIAVLKLSSAVPSSATLKPIKLSTSPVSSHRACQASGWGSLAFNSKQYPDELQAVNVTIQETATCNGTTGYNGLVKEGMLCAGELAGYRDSCQGDSGGPLVCDGMLAGVVSHGYKCGVPGFPGIYTDVQHYSEWIRFVSGANGLASIGGLGFYVLVQVLISLVQSF